MTAPAGNPTPPHSRLWENAVTVVFPIAALVVGIATLVITYQVSRISDLGGDIKNVNGRVDQIYPLIAQSTADIGYIKGNLEATTQKLAAAADANDKLTKRLDALVSNQEAQAKNVSDLSASVSKLSSSIVAQQQQLVEINSKLDQNPLIHRNSFLTDSTVFSPADVLELVVKTTPAAKVVPVDWSDKKGFANFFKMLSESDIDFSKVYLTTKDAAVADVLNKDFQKAGLVK